MDEPAAEKLFLLEFLVDYVSISPTESMMKSVDNDQRLWVRSSTCVTFQFLNYPPLEVCQDDFSTKKCAIAGKALFKNGKSCLFAIPDTQLCGGSPAFVVDVAVHKKLPQDSSLPGQIEVGNTAIQLAELFNRIVELVKNTPECVPVSKTLKDGFPLVDQNGITVGEIKVFIRLSCFGKLIVTQFELGGGNRPFLFKGSEGSGTYECQKVDSNERTCPPKRPPSCLPCTPPQSHQANKAPCPPCAPPPFQPKQTPCPPCQPPQQFPPQQFPPQQFPPPQFPPQPMPYAQPFFPPQSNNPYQQQGPPCPPCGISPDKPYQDVFGYGDKAANQNNTCGSPVCPEQETYEEIGAEVNGHALKIRVPKKKKKSKDSSCGPCAPCAPPPECCPPPKNDTGCAPCAPCGDVTNSGGQNMGMDSCMPCGMPPESGRANGNDGCPPYSISYGAQNMGMDSCCGSSSPYGAQNMAMESCGPCAPCGSNSSYGAQNTAMDSCGACAPCASSSPYGAQNMTMDSCGPCAPCGSPNGQQNMPMDPYGNMSPYGNQNSSGCGPCAPCTEQQPPPQQQQQSACPPCGQQNQVLFTHPCSQQPGKPPESSVFYKVTAGPEACVPGAGGGCCKTIKIEPQIQCPGVGKGNDDCTKDVFVLRIGKKGDGPDHKSNLELELRTPKCPPCPGAPCAAGADKADGGGKNGKDKGGKGKKGKKGKK